jgi:hypothetical protein
MTGPTLHSSSRSDIFRAVFASTVDLLFLFFVPLWVFFVLCANYFSHILSLSSLYIADSPNSTPRAFRYGIGEDV